MHLIVNKMGEFLRDELLANLYQQGGDTVSKKHDLLKVLLEHLNARHSGYPYGRVAN